MEPERKTYWITKYLFTAGITVKQLEYTPDPLYVRYGWNLFRIGCDAHETKDAAIAQAKKMIAKKLASLDKQRAKLQKMAEELAK